MMMARALKVSWGRRRKAARETAYFPSPFPWADGRHTMCQRGGQASSTFQRGGQASSTIQRGSRVSFRRGDRSPPGAAAHYAADRLDALEESSTLESSQERFSATDDPGMLAREPSRESLHSESRGSSASFVGQRYSSALEPLLSLS